MVRCSTQGHENSSIPSLAVEVLSALFRNNRRSLTAFGMTATPLGVKDRFRVGGFGLEGGWDGSLCDSNHRHGIRRHYLMLQRKLLLFRRLGGDWDGLPRSRCSAQFVQHFPHGVGMKRVLTRVWFGEMIGRAGRFGKSAGLCVVLLAMLAGRSQAAVHPVPLDKNTD